MFPAFFTSYILARYIHTNIYVHFQQDIFFFISFLIFLRSAGRQAGERGADAAQRYPVPQPAVSPEPGRGRGLQNAGGQPADRQPAAAARQPAGHDQPAAAAADEVRAAG